MKSRVPTRTDAAQSAEPTIWIIGHGALSMNEHIRVPDLRQRGCCADNRYRTRREARQEQVRAVIIRTSDLALPDAIRALGSHHRGRAQGLGEVGGCRRNEGSTQAASLPAASLHRVGPTRPLPNRHSPDVVLPRRSRTHTLHRSERIDSQHYVTGAGAEGTPRFVPRPWPCGPMIWSCAQVRKISLELCVSKIWSSTDGGGSCHPRQATLNGWRIRDAEITQPRVPDNTVLARTEHSD